MKTIKQEYTIAASAEKVWQALVNPEKIIQWGASPVKMSDKEGDDFYLWGEDYIYGTNTKVVSEKLLEQDWYDGESKWTEPSKVQFTLRSDGHKTILKLVQTNVPDDNVKSIDEGWKEYYLGPLKELVEQ